MHIVISPGRLLCMSEPGIYTLMLSVPGALQIEVGSLGARRYPAGYYCYTGSARGPGGLKRVDRHILLSRDRKRTRRWHIDYLLPWATVLEVYITRTAEDLECRIASAIGCEISPVSGFGCTDCRCPGHLHYSRDPFAMRNAVGLAHAAAKV
ncbi:MAG TPA: GIY-YIG nuclease family protein [Methanothrix sp.]|nr:GIY-YIG nuclease family protein [Methanothrix sp.]HPC89187.1 GIY-YIG nuclease family protein [Methanothrix sp.]HQI67776.1 GIY-YIG nuclease family protein [Methanothrix sp.]HRS84425.1 GIY-YIG nuclease family protein [Methanothrix sp.]HRT16455.1 GIY-YIG nuclease family protein [Methanothrix sp.]